jgi:hypothetical protein
MGQGSPARRFSGACLAYLFLAFYVVAAGACCFHGRPDVEHTNMSILDSTISCSLFSEAQLNAEPYASKHGYSVCMPMQRKVNAVLEKPIIQALFELARSILTKS